MSALLLVLSLSACKGPGPCIDACRDDGSFFDACYESFVNDYQIAVDCYEDIDELGEAIAAAGTDDEARQEVYREWIDADKTYACEDAAEIKSQCKARTRAEFRYLDSDGKLERRDECLDDSDPDAIAEAVDNDDCEGFLKAIGAID